MKCSFCGKETKMTVRNNYRHLYNCCKECYNKANLKEKKLWVSCIFKKIEMKGGETNESKGTYIQTINHESRR